MLFSESGSDEMMSSDVISFEELSFQDVFSYFVLQALLVSVSQLHLSLALAKSESVLHIL